jgi:putative peptidoglycan lipid II flippase
MSATTITDQTMAAWLPSGSVSALNYGNKVSALLVGVGSVALSTTLLPHLSQMVAREEWEAIRLLLRQVARWIIAVTLPATLMFVLLAEPIVRLLYERGAFTSANTTIVASVQSAYLLQLPVHLLGILYVRLISALRANRFLTISAAICVVANVVLDIVFMRLYGVSGIALATAAIYSVSCCILGVAAYRSLSSAEKLARARADLAVATSAATPVIVEERCASAA